MPMIPNAQNASPFLLVVDPVAGRMATVTTAQGLPSPARESPPNYHQTQIAVAPIGQGKVCVAGSYVGRTWVAMASIDPMSGTSLKPIFEATRPNDIKAPKPWQDPAVIFDLAWMAVVGTSPNQGPRVLLGRRSFSQGAIEHPLLIDPGSAKVVALEDRVNILEPSNVSVHDGSISWAFPDQGQNGVLSPLLSLWRFGPPDFRVTPIARDVLSGPAQGYTLFFDGGRVRFLSGETAWSADDPKGPYRPMKGRIPKGTVVDAPRIDRSAHYGLLYLRQYRRAFQVAFEDEPR